MRERISGVLKWVPVCVILALLFYSSYFTGIGIPCPVKSLTGLSCPSCGITRMSVHFIHGDFRGGFYYNQIMPFVLPIVALLVGLHILRYIRTGKAEPGKAELAVEIVLIVLLCVYGVVRNLPFYPWKI